MGVRFSPTPPFFMRVNLSQIETLNLLSSNIDKSRNHLTTTLLSIYSALTSGLFLFASTNKITDKAWFSIVVLSSILIVSLCSLDKFLDYIASGQAQIEYVRELKENKQITVVSSNDITAKVMKTVPWLLIFTLIVNVTGAAGYIISKL